MIETGMSLELGVDPCFAKPKLILTENRAGHGGMCSFLMFFVSKDGSLWVLLSAI